MKNQINYLLLTIIVGAILSALMLYIILSGNSNRKNIEESIKYSQFSKTLQNSVLLLPYVDIAPVNKSLGFLIAYYSTSNNETYCINSERCVNIKEEVTKYFNKIYGDRWNLTIFVVPPLTGWNVQMFLVIGEPIEGPKAEAWDPGRFDPPKDENGKNWYEFDYNYMFVKNYYVAQNLIGAGWINATAPFYQYGSIASWGITQLLAGTGDTIQAVQSGRCIPLSRLLPNSNFTEASIYCPKGEWNVFGAINAKSDPNLPEFVRYNYYLVHYPGPPNYKTGTDITLLAVYLDLINIDKYYKNPVVQAYYRGTVKIPSFCKQVYIDIFGHEVARVYISYLNKNKKPDYVYLFGFKCINNCPEKGDGKTCPLINPNLRAFPCGSPYGVIGAEINITKWVIEERDPDTNYIIVSNVYNDPHLGPNGISFLRLFCITEEGKVHELNKYIAEGGGKPIELGYKIPEGVTVYTFYFYYPIDYPIGSYITAILRTW